MRNEERIPLILEQIKELWLKYPDLRLGQLLLNVAADPHLYYMEDQELVDKLNKFYRDLDGNC